MRVLTATPLYPPHSRVGAWLATHQFMRHLVDAGHQVTAVMMVSSAPGCDFEGVRVESAKRGRSHVVGMADWHDVIVAHYGDGGAGEMVARKSGKPLVQMVHGFIGRAPTPELLVFNSHASRDACPHEAPSIVCHPPVRADEHRTERGDHITIVNCSREKGIDTVWRVADALPGHRFLGVKGGYGTQREPRCPNFTTIPTTSDMRGDVWGKTRILLMPSEKETYGMAGVEAMASGIPVVAHPTPGLREALGSAGIFVDRDDVDGWVSTITRLDDPDEYAAASERAFARSAELDPTDDFERFRVAVEAVAAGRTLQEVA